LIGPEKQIPTQDISSKGLSAAILAIPRRFTRYNCVFDEGIYPKNSVFCLNL
jgi:hypothetical protein